MIQPTVNTNYLMLLRGALTYFARIEGLKAQDEWTQARAHVTDAKIVGHVTDAKIV